MFASLFKRRDIERYYYLASEHLQKVETSRTFYEQVQNDEYWLYLYPELVQANPDLHKWHPDLFDKYKEWSERPPEPIVHTNTEDSGEESDYPHVQFSFDIDDFDEFSRIISVLKEEDSIEQQLYFANLLRQQLGSSFSNKVLRLIQDSGLKNTQVYRAAHIDRRLFSKIISDKNYTPSKDTVLSFIFALKLNKDEAFKLLATAGYTLSPSIERDAVMRFFIDERLFDFDIINGILHKLHLKPLGA